MRRKQKHRKISVRPEIKHKARANMHIFILIGLEYSKEHQNDNFTSLRVPVNTSDKVLNVITLRWLEYVHELPCTQPTYINENQKKKSKYSCISIASTNHWWQQNLSQSLKMITEFSRLPWAHFECFKTQSKLTESSTTFRNDLIFSQD